MGACALALVHAAMFVRVAAQIAGSFRSAGAARAAVVEGRASLHALRLDDLPWAMPQLLALVPDDAELLVVTGALVPWPVAMYAAPRRTQLLCWIDDRLLARADRLDDVQQFLLAYRLATLEREGRRFTPDRFERGLAEANYLLVLAPAPPEAQPPPGTCTQLLVLGDEADPAAELFRIERR